MKTDTTSIASYHFALPHQNLWVNCGSGRVPERRCFTTLSITGNLAAVYLFSCELGLAYLCAFAEMTLDSAGEAKKTMPKKLL